MDQFWKLSLSFTFNKEEFEKLSICDWKFQFTTKINANKKEVSAKFCLNPACPLWWVSNTSHYQPTENAEFNLSFDKGNKALNSEILSRSSPKYLTEIADLNFPPLSWFVLNHQTCSLSFDSKFSNHGGRSKNVEMTCSKFPILRLYYLYVNNFKVK